MKCQLSRERGREMLSDSYKEKKITFVMGAGASLPFIANSDTCLSTKYLTEQISDRNKWITIYDEFKKKYSFEKISRI